MERGGWGGREKQHTELIGRSQASCLQSWLLGEHAALVRVCKDGSTTRSQAQMAAGRIAEDRQGRWCQVGTPWKTWIASGPTA